MNATAEDRGSANKSNAPTSKDNSDFVDLLTLPHARHEVRNAVLGHTNCRE